MWILNDWASEKDWIEINTDSKILDAIKISNGFEQHSIHEDTQRNYLYRKFLISAKYETEYYSNELTLRLNWYSEKGTLAIHSLKAIYFASCPTFSTLQKNKCVCNKGYQRKNIEN